MFSGSIKRDQWHEMAQCLDPRPKNNKKVGSKTLFTSLCNT